MKSLRHTAAALAAAASILTPRASPACSSCGCILSSDWASQGYVAGAGFHLDLRLDAFDQDVLRAGTGAVDRRRIARPAGREIQQTTINRNLALNLDYSSNAVWGASLQVPFFDRRHTTVAAGDTAVSASHTRSVGDVRVIARYQGFSPDRTTGVQFGLKLATGAFDADFTDGPEAGTPLDRGLQPGTGTTDLLLGAYHFGALGRYWNYFAQALVQQPLNSRRDFKPGTGLNANFGVRYTASRSVVPQIQLNLRAEERESGAEADVENSGATLVYLGPGITARVAPGLSAYAFVQVPVYENVNGYQLEPRFAASVGLSSSF